MYKSYVPYLHHIRQTKRLLFKVVLSCRLKRRRQPGTTLDNYTKCNDLFGGTKKSDYLCNVNTKKKGK